MASGRLSLTSFAGVISTFGSFGNSIDRFQLVHLAEEADTPEMLTEQLLPEHIDEQEDADQIYLIVFELCVA